jgi:selenocysteine lyase/cysteine desulfurase
MHMSRRKYLSAVAALPIVGAAVTAASAAPRPADIATPATALPAKSAFAATDITYLDNGSQHPISLGAKKAVDAYFAKRMLDPVAQAYALDEAGLLSKFARLVNVDPDELSLVQSTTAGEQAVIRALGLPQVGGHVVTETLHFFGSMPLYEDLAKRGVEVSWVPQVDGRIRLADMKAAIRKGTRLVAVSLVSTVNGFEHDLKAICDLAHAQGALVYADIIHAAGCVPLDLRASGVDFAACASYKWLMGDFGLGFLYVRKDALPQLTRANWGYYGVSSIDTHVYPLDTPGERVASYSFSPNTTGAFAIGTHSHAIIAQLHHSLDWIETIGVSAIQRHAQSLIAHLREELVPRGYAIFTPEEARTPILTVVLEGARNKLAQPMKAARVRMTISENRFRLTPSLQNDHGDIERFLKALPSA